MNKPLSRPTAEEYLHASRTGGCTGCLENDYKCSNKSKQGICRECRSLAGKRSWKNQLEKGTAHTLRKCNCENASRICDFCRRRGD